MTKIPTVYLPKIATGKSMFNTCINISRRNI